MSTTDKLLIDLEENGHITFTDTYDFRRFRNSLSEEQKEKLIFDQEQKCVFVKNVL